MLFRSRMATTPPYGPVVIVADATLQEEGIASADRPRLRVPRLTPTSPPAADAGAVAELAKLLVAAENPYLFAGRVARTPKGLSLLVELADLLQAAVVEGRFVYRMNFPNRHPLKMALGTTLAEADLVLSLEHPELFHYMHAMTPPNRLGRCNFRSCRLEHCHWGYRQTEPLPSPPMVPNCCISRPKDRLAVPGLFVRWSNLNPGR